jgi:hypothetical protein
MLSRYHECSCGVQRVDRAISRKTPSWVTSVVTYTYSIIYYSGEIDRTGLKILENNKNIQSIFSVNTNILLRRFRLKFLRIMYSYLVLQGTLQLRKHPVLINNSTGTSIYFEVGNNVCIFLKAFLQMLGKITHKSARTRNLGWTVIHHLVIKSA